MTGYQFKALSAAGSRPQVVLIPKGLAKLRLAICIHWLLHLENIFIISEICALE